MKVFFRRAPLLASLIAWLALGTVFAGKGKPFQLGEYLPQSVGGEWVYKNLAPDGLSPIVIRMPEKTTFRGRDVVKRTENNGDYRFQTFDRKNGLVVHHLYFIGDKTIDYEKPMTVFPATFKLGESHKAVAGYTYSEKGVEKDRGTQTYETSAVGVERAETPLGVFPECLVLRTVALRVDGAGTQKGYDLREWHAKGIGPVKIVGELYWKNKEGVTTRTFKIDAVLENTNLRK